MNTENQKDRDRHSPKIDEVLDEAVENAEARRELSEDELDEVAGGVTTGGVNAGVKVTLGLIAQDNKA